MSGELEVSTDKAKVVACVKRITKAIGKECPSVVAAACLMVLEFSVDRAEIEPSEKAPK